MRTLSACVALFAATLLLAATAEGQNGVRGAPGGIHGQVADPTGAVIPGATVVATTTAGKVAGKATADGVGAYAIHGLAPGTYGVTATANGFAQFQKPGVVVSAGQMRTVNATLVIQVQQQNVEVQAESNTVSTSPESNANAIVIKGSALNALSDDPDELQNELEALAGPSAGPNGGQIYIDGFTGGQLPPKSSIREIRINQNPFSAEYDRLGYGRIEIFTKPGTGQMHGEIEGMGNDSTFNSQNALFNSQQAGAPEPPYDTWDMHGYASGPITKSTSYFVSAFGRQQLNMNIVKAIDPASITPSANLNDLPSLNEAFGNPSSRLDISPRIDLQLGSLNTLTIRETYNRMSSTNSIGSNGLTLPQEATNSEGQENAVQLWDSWTLNKNLVDDIRFQYRRIRDQASAVSNLPSFTVQGQFSDGGNTEQASQDHENNYELQNYFSGVLGAHTLNFGARARAYDDVNYTLGGSNGAYIFSTAQSFLGCYQTPKGSPPPSTCVPQQYTYTKINNPVAHATLFDAALFYQDDWKVRPQFTFSYGVRWETQNWISDKDDWAPRISLAYALGRKAGTQPKTVLRAGYGWFYQRFTVANGFGANVPYVINTIHENGSNEQQYIQTSGITFNQYSTTALSASSSGVSTGRNAPTFYTIAPNFHAANDMEAAVGVDRQITKEITGNVTYVFSQGIHQFFTDNLSAAPEFPLANSQSDTYPTAAPTEPATNNLQYQSGGFYRENQIMVTVRAMTRKFSLFGNYTYTNARGDTEGVGSVPSVSSDPGLDYGRTHFDIRNRFMLFGNLMLPWAVSVSPMVVVNSGTPFNITTGSDLTGNNQFNGRPTYAASCSEPTAIQTQWGCFDAEPYGTENPEGGAAIEPYAANEKIAPYGLGTGPANVSINMRLAKVIGIGPKIESSGGGFGHGGYHGGPHGLSGGLSGNQGGIGPMNEAVPRKYSLTFSAWCTNLFNHENLGTPNGMIGPGYSNGIFGPQRYFGRSQTLAGGFFASPTAGNRDLWLQAMFSF